MIQALLVTICLAVFPYQGSSTILESGKVKDYEVVYPQKVPALPKGGGQRNEQKMKYEDIMQYEFKVNGEPVVLHLQKNMRLFSKDYSETHYSPDGREITTNPLVEDHCYYHGYIKSDTDSTATISACEGLNGYFEHQGEMYLIEPLKLSNSEAHAVFKYESLEKKDESHKTCGVTHSTWKSDEPIEKASKIFATPEEENKYLEAEKYVELYIVVDNLMFRKYNRNFTTVRRRVFEILNYVNKYYKPLNIHITLIGLEIWSDEDKIAITALADPTLDSFAAWRFSDLQDRKKNDNAMLLTTVFFDEGTLGVAFIGGMCNSYFSAGVIQDNSIYPILTAGTMTHEMGHNFGMNHDRDSCTCRNGPCIMNAADSMDPPKEFTSCNLWEFQKYIMREVAQCTLNDPLNTDIVTTTVCGNGFVEEGEDCDCGLPEQCTNQCCEAATCKLKLEAECAEGACCEECQLKKAGELCRAAKDDCDLPELCTGQSAKCPMDRSHSDGHPCQNNLGYCYMGGCPILANQCIALLGPGIKVAPDSCFVNNQKGDEIGHCRKENDRNIPCEPKDIKCGRLFCVDDANEKEGKCKLTFSKENADAGMVEPGTKCGEGMVCQNGQCVELETAYGSTISFSHI